MKKKIFVSLLLLSIQFQNVYATSGACSYHGGVNCFAGASISGYAVCNDGWESSTYFSSTDECKNTDPCSLSYSLQTINSYINSDSLHRRLTTGTINVFLKNEQDSLSDLNNSIESSNQSLFQQYESERNNALDNAKAMAYASNPYAASTEGADYGANVINQKYDRLEAQIQTSSTYTRKIQSCIDSLTNLKEQLQELDNSSPVITTVTDARTQQIMSQLLNADNVYAEGVKNYEQAHIYSDNTTRLDYFTKSQNDFDTANNLLLIDPIVNYSDSNDLSGAISNLRGAIVYSKKAIDLMVQGINDNSKYIINKSEAEQNIRNANSKINSVITYFSKQPTFCPTNATISSDGKSCSCNSGTIFKNAQCVFLSTPSSQAITTPTSTVQNTITKTTNQSATYTSVTQSTSTKKLTQTSIVVPKAKNSVIKASSSTSFFYSSSTATSTSTATTSTINVNKSFFLSKLFHYINPFNWFKK